MMFTVNKMYILPDAGNLKAFADVAYYGIIIKGVRIINGVKGTFVTMPQEQGKDNKWYDQVVCLNAATYEALTKAVLYHYARQARTELIHPVKAEPEGTWTNLV